MERATSASVPIAAKKSSDVMPGGSPCFENVMNELIRTIPQKLAVAEEPKAGGSNQLSPIPQRKQFVESDRPWKRASSWNVRNRKAAERRREIEEIKMQKIKTRSQPNTPEASPALQRKKIRHKIKGETPKVKYKFVTQNLAVSHEDLIKDEEQDQKSIFSTPEIYRRFPSNDVNI